MQDKDLEGDPLVLSYDFIIGLCTLVFWLETLIGFSHYDLRPENLMMFEQKSVSEDFLQLSASGTLEIAPCESSWQPRLIDFGSVRWGSVHRCPGPSTVKYSCPHQLLQRGHLVSAVAHDRFTTGRLVAIAANEGKDPFDYFKESDVWCPKEVLGFLQKAFKRIPQERLWVLRSRTSQIWKFGRSRTTLSCSCTRKTTGQSRH